MTLSTLIACSAESNRQAEIEQLVKSSYDLDFLGLTTLPDAMAKIESDSPQLVWIDMSPDPDEAMKLLMAIKERFPLTHCIMSNDDLDANLLKIVMQVGAFDFLDSKTWNDQFEDVINRLILKEKAQKEEKERLAAEREKIKEVLEATKEAAKHSTSLTNIRAIKKVREETSEMEGRASANLYMLLLLLALIAGLAFFMPR